MPLLDCLQCGGRMMANHTRPQQFRCMGCGLPAEENDRLAEARLRQAEAPTIWNGERLATVMSTPAPARPAETPTPKEPDPHKLRRRVAENR